MSISNPYYNKFLLTYLLVKLTNRGFPNIELKIYFYGQNLERMKIYFHKTPAESNFNLL